ncbi:alphaK I4 [Puccinia graminis f. sp. tritici CRL 75-36-700-3]|uniref:AlphaK I4 n=1 Tax=Puccinia graminis f. sp. tritici (strain CRL 75-36-700-3 / race SCCL) TaxID=418459 RepID=E3K901_PUCGT|nr:alphaK I4 [Puccinia graminis f. sp. tritici CRL 75-36-700-3]EFP80566.2 alphaK I4 [Puccinia graminis f. sp. tritici CRL 75-36-700-3]
MSHCAKYHTSSPTLPTTSRSNSSRYNDSSESQFPSRSLSLPSTSRQFFEEAIKSKCKKNPSTSPYPKKKPQSSSSKHSHKVDLNNPNFFYDLLEKLWDVFSKELPTKTSIKQLPPDVANFVSLSQGKSCLTNPESLLFVLEKSTDKKPVQIDLTYQHPDPEVQEEYEDSSSDSEPNFEKSETRLEKRNNTSNRNSSIGLSGSNTQSKWALGGLACTMPSHGAVGLKAQLGFLGQGTLSSPITLRVNQDQVIGQGSMRITYKAVVKIVEGNGEVTLVDYVAKKRFHDLTPSVEKHATNALMYEASALLLDSFKKVLSRCRALHKAYRKKLQLLEVIRHAVVVTGDVDIPSKVYFIEAALKGKYVKYSSNTDFNVDEEEEGIDPIICRLMNTFTHWSYHESAGQQLICDLQGVGPIITDPQIIDVDQTRWADGNNSNYGIRKLNH